MSTTTEAQKAKEAEEAAKAKQAEQDKAAAEKKAAEDKKAAEEKAKQEESKSSSRSSSSKSKEKVPTEDPIPDDAVGEPELEPNARTVKVGDDEITVAPTYGENWQPNPVEAHPDEIKRLEKHFKEREKLRAGAGLGSGS